jgi:ribulose-5-phosphate 4-epimerase/fuculose-1-phosphate aldolase
LAKIEKCVVFSYSRQHDLHRLLHLETPESQGGKVMVAVARNILDLSDFPDAERAVRIELAAAYRLVALYGWDDLIFTHLSARVPGEDRQFLINPYGMMFDEITASSLVTIDLDGNPVGKFDSPYPVNNAGYIIHSAVYEVRNDVHCVMHLHTPDGTAVSSSIDGLLPLNQKAQFVIPELTYLDYEGVAVEQDERASIQNALGSKNIMLMRNHGTMTAGRTVAEAFLRMYDLERACMYQVRTRSLGSRDCRIPDEVLQKNAAFTRSEEFSQCADRLVWPALIRKLDRTDQSYRD